LVWDTTENHRAVTSNRYTLALSHNVVSEYTLPERDSKSQH
jgi:hypothetical protein